MMKIGDEVVMRKHRNRRRKNSRKFIIITAVCLLFVMTAGYAAFSTNLNITAKGNVLEQDRVIQSWTETSGEDFHSDYYKENIVSATFLDNNNVPDNATESWNVSEDKNKGGVMAWVIPNSEDSTKYDLYIGANGGVVANEDSGHLFYSFLSLTSINFNDNFDTSNVINMLRLFTNCRELTYLNLSSFDTRNVINMSGMFMSTSSTDFMKIETIIFGEKFVTSNVTNMAAMFGNCSNLKNLDLSNFNTSNVTNMSDMFTSCSSLTELDVSNFNTEKVIYMQGMFWHCFNITSLNLCSFNTTNVTNMNLMFENSSSLSVIYAGPNWTTANASTTNMFTDSGVSSVTTGQCESISN